MAESNVYHVRFPGGITLEVRLQDPHPVDLTVKFSDGSGVHFTYAPDKGNHGNADTFGGAAREPASGIVPGTLVRVRPAKSTGSGMLAGPATTDVAIQYYEPQGSRM